MKRAGKDLSRHLAITLLAVGLLGACGSSDESSETSTMAQESPPVSNNPAHATAALLTPEIAARITPLQTKLAENPGNLDVRKEIAVILLTSGQLLPAYEHAEVILQANPDDHDGLYVHGVVRIAMGQSRRAIEIFDRLLARNPHHIPALTARGRAEMKQGNIAGAISTWERGLAAAGGRHAGLEELLREARGTSPTATWIPVPEPAEDTRDKADDEAVAEDAEGSVANDGGEAYEEAKLFHLLVDLAPGTRIDEGATLVASLRSLTGGPPAAVKKIDAPSFPLELTLGPGDASGSPLPVLGILQVRLDGGEELSAEATAVSGDSTTLVLAAG